jgi:hypothetical protein
MAWFDSNKLNWPKDGDINAWADFAETLCIFSEDNAISLDEFMDYLLDDPAKKISEVLTALNFNEAFLPQPMRSAPVMKKALDQDEDDGDEDFSITDVLSEEKEKLRSRCLLLFDFLKSRKTYFGDYYPFFFKSTQINYVILDEESVFHRLYRVLLLASEMNIYTPVNIVRMGHLFELLCQRPFNQLVPALAEKRFFGAGGGTIIPADYNGNLKERIEQLAVDLNILTNPVINDPDELGPTGDAGLDWVGWMIFEDACDHQPVYFAQCACGANWVGKQHETSLAAWRNYLIINQSIQCFHFMPRSFRRNSLSWFRSTKIIQELSLIDRFRMMKMFSMEDANDILAVLVPFTDILEESYTFKYAS